MDTPNDSNLAHPAGQSGSGSGLAEAELQATQERLQFLLSSTPAMIYTCDASRDFRLSFMSQNVAIELGFEAREFMEDPGFWASHIHPEDMQSAHLDLPSVLSSGHRVCEYRFLHRDGNYHWLHDEARLVVNQGARGLEIAGYLLDITERRKAEDEVATRARQLAEAQSVAHVGSWDWDIANHVVQWSDEQYRIFGVTRRETAITFEEIMGLVHPQDVPVVDEALRRAFEGIRPYHQAVRIIRPDGTQRTISSRGVVVRDRDGRPVRMHGTVQDITELKRASDALKHSEDRFTAFMRNLPGAAFIRDRDGRYLYANALAALREQPES